MTIKRRRYGRTGHGYQIDGEKVPGVTTIIGATVPKNLTDWAARSAADHAINYWDELAALLPSERHNRLHWAYRDDRDQAAKRGTEVHRLASGLAEGETVAVPDELAGHVEAYRDWLDTAAPVVVATELVVASRAHRFCGQSDLVADLGDVLTEDQGVIPPGRWLIELKTTRSGVWPESALQATAYSRAEVYVHPDHPDDEQPMAALGIQHCGVVWIRSDTAELHPVDHSDAVWDYFTRLRWLYDRADDMPGWIGATAAAAPAAAFVT